MKRGAKSKASQLGTCPFLDCLDQLDDDAVAEVLLPKLAARTCLETCNQQAYLALTCSRLRQLVHGSLGVLDFSGLAEVKDNLKRIKSWTAALPGHFPSCEVVRLHISSDSSHDVIKKLMPALSGLPKLSFIHLDISDDSTDPTRVNHRLRAFKRKLPGLQGCRLDCTSPWAAAASAKSPWQQLGSMTQLTWLNINFEDVWTSGQLCGLQHLGGLQQLQHLVLTQEWDEKASTHAAVEWDLSFLSQLTGLTAFTLKLPAVSRLCSISSCCQLAVLEVQEPVSHMLSAAECVAISHLTRLKTLHLGREWQLVADALPVFHSALHQLQQLQPVSLHMWTPKVLPVFAQLTRLRTILGAWPRLQGQQDLNTTALDSCPHVKELYYAAGSVPFSAFPGLLTCSLGGSIPPSALSALAEYCPALVTLDADYSELRLKLSDFEAGCCTLQGEQAAERVAAILSLGQLSALTALTLHVRDDAEVAALAASAVGVDTLRVVVPRGVTVTSCALVQLGALPHLKDLCLELYGLGSSELVKGARMLVCGLCHVKHVGVLARYNTFRACEDALAWASAVGLPVPQLECTRKYIEDDLGLGCSDEDSSLSLSDSDGDSLSLSDSDDW